MTSSIPTSLEEIHFLNRVAFVVLFYAVISGIKVVKIDPIDIQQSLQHVTTLPSAMWTLPFGLSLPTALPPPL